MNVGVLASGGGTNLQALIDAQLKGVLLPAKVVVVGSNVPGCGAMERAVRAGLPAFAIDHKQFAQRAEFDDQLALKLQAFNVECVVLAGFMRLLSASFLERFEAGVINIHPALLPAFPGVHAQKQALEYGVKFAGCTVHFVDAGMDTGPIIAQAVIPVRHDDTEASLQKRLLQEEHKLLPAAVRAHAEGRIVREGRHVRLQGASLPTPDSSWSSLPALD